MPCSAHTHGINRRFYDIPKEAWNSLQRTYNFQCVYTLPREFTGMTLLNSPVTLFEAQANEAAEKHAMKCDFVGCTFSSSNMKAVKMHKTKCHEEDMNAQKGKKTLSCDCLGCSYTAQHHTATQS